MSVIEKIKDSLIILKDMLLDFLKIEHGYTLGICTVMLLGVLFELFGWWYLMLVAGGFAGFLMKKSGLFSFLVGFLGIAFVWSCFFIYFLTIGPLFEFTALIASVLGMFESFPNIFILLTIFIGGLLGGLGALNGTYLANIIYHIKENSPKESNLNKKKIVAEKGNVIYNEEV
ncbi:MAG: hypothetical protein ACTSYB_02775 [Candidatus Helarchaeota archaeon]